jgi:diguanylate cyclase (GGDEF)-like protein
MVVRLLNHRAVRQATCVLLAAGRASYVALTISGHGAGTPATLLYEGLLVTAALVCLARVVAIPRDRLPWALLAAGLAAWASADIYYAAVLIKLAEPPYPSIADAGWLVYYPALYAVMLLLARRGRAGAPSGAWLDGAIAALGATALMAAVFFKPILAIAVEGNAAAIATNLAYPIGDLVLLMLVTALFALSGWRPDRMWLALGAGMAASAIADSWYLAELAKGTYGDGQILGALWPASALLIAWAAWQPERPPAEARVAGLRVIAMPAGFALMSIALLVYDHFDRVSGLAVALAAATLGVAVLRMGSSFLANVRMLDTSRHEALTDALTGLGNRRSLMHAVEHSMRPEDGDPETLVLFDLDGFKRYNDTFGHPAGDALLQRLGSKLARTVEGRGRAFRMGGDEFCVLLSAPAGERDALVTAAATALTETGQGFAIGASHGMVVPALEAATAAEALQTADRRMYGHKASRSAGRTSETRDVLMRILREREPELHQHLTSVADLARAVGIRLGLVPEALDEIARAAELHDVGKMAIPDAILDKPGPLDEREWAFIRRHTLIGESILSAAPALVPVARIVRASHERFDGAGYPDMLGGHDIPLGARIVAVCDAYDAMTSDRSYRAAMSPEAARAELRAAAGTQFDPEVVEVFCEVVAGRAVRAVTS